MLEKRLLCCLLFILGPTVAGQAQQTYQSGTTLPLTQGLVVSRVLNRSRAPLKADPVALRLTADPETVFSKDDEVTVGDQKRSWQIAQAAENGQFQGREFSGSYLQFLVESDADQIVLLEANGHGSAIVNGAFRTGNPYSKWQQLPIRLRQGQNKLLFQVSRGRFNGKLMPMKKSVHLSTGDMTLPTILTDQPAQSMAAMPLINGTAKKLENLEIHTQIGKLPISVTPVGPIPALSLRKVGFKIQPPEQFPDKELKLSISLVDPNIVQILDSQEITLEVAESSTRHQRTFVSRIDGSVQYYGVTQALTPNENRDTRPGLILSLHGAGVEGRGQSNCYQQKTDLHAVAPTNRRVFGFDWEDWGRIDAMEVLQDAMKHLEVDPLRVYLSGHSMGGHGTWQLGAHFPDRFAAIGPSAGWISFWTYAGGSRDQQPTPVLEALQRAANPSDTLLLKNNYTKQGVFILHGDRDRNVPVSQARQMRKELADFHPDFSYYEQPGAGHWWGNQCVDWPPMIEFFRRHNLLPADQLNEIDFTTVSPGITSQYGWATVVDQIKPLLPSRIQLSLNRRTNSLKGVTENVRRLKLDLPEASLDDSVAGKYQVELDGTTLEASVGINWLIKIGDNWAASNPPDATSKGPARYGLFKSAFDHRFVLVYSTGGTDEENRWSLNKARADAETFWYRGNGSVDVVADTELIRQGFEGRNIIVYGNADTNRAWPELLGECPLQLKRNKAWLGGRVIENDRLAALFIYPRPNSDRNLVGVIGGTGIHGLRATNPMRYFVSGIAFPDVTLVSADYLELGNQSLVVAGYWNSEWQLDAADVVWK